MKLNDNLTKVNINLAKLTDVIFITDIYDNWIIAKFVDYRIINSKLIFILTDVYFNNIKLTHDMYINFEDIEKIRYASA